MSILKLKDSQGNWVGVPTLKGDKGNGIQSAILNDDYTLTLTFTDGTTYKTPSIRGEKGEKGEPATDMDIHICSASEYDSETRIPTITSPDDKTFYLVPTEDGTSPDLFTEWVYVNNAWEMFGSASIDLTDYVKNTDYATQSIAGVVRVNDKFGILLGSNGLLMLDPSTSTDVKAGTEAFKTLTPYNQSASTFYGLAKASGHDEKDSELPVGQYTDEAKSSIQDMLDVPSTSELKEVNDSKADVIVESASGDIVSFNDGADGMPLKSLVVDINPVQNLNGYDHPWVGGGGKNLFDATLMRDREAWYNIAVKVKPSTKYTMSTDKGTQTSTGLALYFNNTNTQGGGSASILYSGNPVTVTSTEDGYVYVSQRRVSGEDSFQNYHYQIEEGNTATDWTPYENICPISGWTGANVVQSGKNLLNPILMKDQVAWNIIKFYAPVGTTLTMSTDCDDATTATGLLVYFRQPDGAMPTAYNVKASRPVTQTVGTSGYVEVVERNPSGTVSFADFQWQIEIGDTATEYEPYKGRTINVNWETEAGTVYGGKLDVLSGILTVKYKKLHFVKDYIIGVTDGNTDCAPYTAISATIGNAIGKKNHNFYGDKIIRNKLNKTEIFQGFITSDNKLVFGLPSYLSTLDLVKDWMDEIGGFDIVYPIAEPTEIQLTPQEVKSLLGTNNIWADTGNTSVEYCADTEMYIEKVKPVINVDDVQINGASIVDENGVANVPVGGSSVLGAVQTNTNFGINATSDGVLYINGANSTDSKTGTNSYRPVVPVRQHESTFYGLAKASGDSTQSASSNAVGNYTDEAKVSIQNMLGITDKYTPKDWMAESETELVTNAHNIGDLFYIGETLYKVIADLNAGDAINVGVNVEEVDVNNILTDYATKEEVENNVSIIEKSASGAVASFTDGADDIPLKSLVVDINPVQDLHGQDAPYPAGGGKNKFNVFALESKDGLTVNSDGTLTTTKPVRSGKTLAQLAPNLIVGETYKLLVTSTGTGNLYIYLRDIPITWNYGTSKTITQEMLDSEVNFYATTEGVSTTLSNIMIMDASITDVSYMPYENICPISGWTGANVNVTGKNQLKAELTKGANSTIALDITKAPMIISGRQYILSFDDVANATSWRIACVLFGANGERIYTGSDITSGTLGKHTSGRYYVTGSNGTLKQATFTANVTCYVMFFLVLGDISDTSVTVNGQLEFGTVKTDYEARSNQTIPINWQTEAGTVYGGKLDVLSGVMRVDRAMVDLGTLTWNYYAGNTNMPVFYARLDGIVIGVKNRAICSALKCTDWQSLMERTDKTICRHPSLDLVYVADADRTDHDASAFTSSVIGVQYCYYLATPIEIQLDAHTINSLLGVNNIWADTGDTSIEYFSQVDEDLTDYIEANLNSYAKKELLNNYVTDVQIGETSLVDNGVVSIPYGSNDNYGVLKASSTNGIFAYDGVLSINNASVDDIKGGEEELKPLTPNREHMAVFYGLTKAAGVDMSTSSNAVGTYTDEAKTAIKQMLGIHDTIDSFVEEVTGTDVTITGQPSYRYNCGELYSLTVTPPSSGTIDIRFTSGSTPTVLTLPSTVKMPEWWVEVEANTIYEMCITDGIYCGVMTWAI